MFHQDWPFDWGMAQNLLILQIDDFQLNLTIIGGSFGTRYPNGLSHCHCLNHVKSLLPGVTSRIHVVVSSRLMDGRGDLKKEQLQC